MKKEETLKLVHSSTTILQLALGMVDTLVGGLIKKNPQILFPLAQ